MPDEEYFEKCENCGRAVQKVTGYNDNYDGWKTTGRETIEAFEKRHIVLPETEKFDVKVCQQCIEKDPALKELKQKMRVDWYKDELKKAERDRQRITESIATRTKLINALDIYQVNIGLLLSRVEKGETVTEEEIPEYPEK